MNEICGDNRFEIIAKAKKHLLDATNIDTSPKEMEVLDDFLFRCQQMGWLKQYEEGEPIIETKPKRGKWGLTRTVKTNSCPEHWLRCSLCGKYRIIKTGEAMPDYCENCGARMAMNEPQAEGSEP